MSTLSWTRERDHVLGPFLYAKETHRNWEFVVSSPREEYPVATCRLRLAKNTFIVALPRWLVRPEKKLREFTQRDGTKSSYTEIVQREFGVQLFEGRITFKFGRQPMEWPGDKSWGFYIPWTQTRFVRHSYLTSDGSIIRSFGPRKGSDGFLEQLRWADTLETENFRFLDFDGEEIVVKTKIEEREWLHGIGAFKWLSWFRKPIINRVLDLDFSKETGRRKGSWKGGTTGHSVSIDVGETPESAFRRYCENHDMTFVGPCAESEAVK